MVLDDARGTTEEDRQDAVAFKNAAKECAAERERLGDDDFRICVPRDDARKQYCMFIDTEADTVKYDPSTLPNQEFKPR